MNALVLLLCVAAVELMPAPKSIVVDEKVQFQITHTTPVVIGKRATPEMTAQLEALFAVIGFTLPVLPAAEYTATEDAIFIGTAGQHPTFEKRRLRSIVESTEGLAPGGYRISVRRNAVVVAGVDAAGTFYALQSLIQWVRQAPQAWPGVSILDWPDLAYRGVVAHGPLAEVQLKNLATSRCNLVFFESDQFFALDAPAAETWRRVFADARKFHIEPVPVMDAQNNAAMLLAKYPLAAEGRTVLEEIWLTGDSWHPLVNRHILFSETSPVEVRVSGYLCKAGEDYLLMPGDFEAPFYPSSRPARLQRLPQGAIPEGATVSVRYSYVSQNTKTLCPHAPEAATALSAALKRVQTVLAPKFIHLGAASTGGLNGDIRCLAKNRSENEIALDTVKLFVNRVKVLKNAPKLFMGDERIHPFQEGNWRPLAKVGNGVPRQVSVVQHARRGTFAKRAQAAQRLSWVAQHAEPLLIAVGDDGAAAPMLAKLLMERDTNERGLVFSGRHHAGIGVLRVLQTAWSIDNPTSTWAIALNEYFDAMLWAPDADARLEAVASYIDQQTINGVSPQEQQNLFDAFLDRLTPKSLKEDPLIENVAKLHKNMTDYLALEAVYNEDRDAKALRRLIPIIMAQRKWNDAVDESRLTHIVDTVERNGSFVPASVLFGRTLAYFRQTTIPVGDRVFEVPSRVSYTDTPGSAIADIDLLAQQGPLHRIDYEVAATKRLVATGTVRGKQDVMIQEQAAVAGQTLRGPMLLGGETEVAQLRLTTEASGTQAVLRELKVFARKSPPRITCAFDSPTHRTEGASPPELKTDSARGFLNLAARRFSAAPTEITVTRSRTHLIVGITAKEQRMATMVSKMTGEDAPLWEEESVEILLLLDRGNKKLYRFLVGPRGGRFDSLSGDAGWDADWNVITREEQDGWVAVVALPFDLFGGAPEVGERWYVNFLRHRHNVIRETSAWAHQYESTASPQFGELSFR